MAREGVFFAAAGERSLLRVAFLVAAISVVPRLVHLDVPPLDRHDFRQTQTAITVQSFLDHGVKVFRYETPVFGPPWTVPFEFPLFQLLAYAVAKILGLNVDLACRLTAVLCFYASAAMLFVLVRHWTSARLAALALATYVLSPFSVIWSRAVLIDYTSVALALGYLHATLLWSLEGRAAAAIWAVPLGALGAVTKITTGATVAVPVALALAWRVHRSWVARRSEGRPLLDLGVAAAIAGIPLAAGIGWTMWVDAIKASQPATAALTSLSLARWNFGTWSQRTALDGWGHILGWVVTAILPGAFALSLLLAIPFFRGSEPRLRRAGWAALAGLLLPVALFFNLYWVHDYYLIALTPSLAFLAAAGMSWLLDQPWLRRPAVATAVLVVACLSTVPSWSYAAPTYEVSRTSPVARLGSLVARHTRPGDWVAVQGDEWNSRILYASRRRGFMVWEPHTDVAPLASRPEFGALVCQECPPQLLSLFPRRRLVGHEASWDVYRVWPEGGDPL